MQKKKKKFQFETSICTRTFPAPFFCLYFSPHSFKQLYLFIFTTFSQRSSNLHTVFLVIDLNKNRKKEKTSSYSFILLSNHPFNTKKTQYCFQGNTLVTLNLVEANQVEDFLENHIQFYLKNPRDDNVLP